MIHSKAFYQLNKFIRPGGYYPQPYTIEQAFGVFQWMVSTALKTYKWRHASAIELLSCSSARGLDNVYPIKSVEDLRLRFQWALLESDTSDSCAEWRAKYKIKPNSRIQIRFPYYTPFGGGTLCGNGVSEHEIQTALELFFNLKGTLNKSLNSYHPKARTIKRTDIFMDQNGYKFRIDYGYANDSSGWWHTLASSPSSKPFTDGLSLALSNLYLLCPQDWIKKYVIYTGTTVISKAQAVFE